MTPARRAFAAWAPLTLLGALLIALPDDDRRVFSFTEGHGPAPLDLSGIALVALGTLAYFAGLFLGRRGLRGRDAGLAFAAYLPSVAFAGWSVATDTGRWWLLGVAAALAAHAWLAWRVCGAAAA